MLFLVLFIRNGMALAEALTYSVRHLPLNEAVQIAQSLASPQGKVATLESKRMLIIVDEPQRLTAILQLLRRLDRKNPAYEVTLEIRSIKEERLRKLAAHVVDGGWILLAQDDKDKEQTTSRLMLRLQAGREGEMVIGKIVPLRPWIRRRLAGHGLVSLHTVTLVPVTTGFRVRVHASTTGRALVSLTPWMRRLESERTVYLNRAHTEISVPLGRWIHLAAVEGEAESFGRALASRCEAGTRQSLVLRLHIAPAR